MDHINTPTTAIEENQRVAFAPSQACPIATRPAFSPRLSRLVLAGIALLYIGVSFTPVIFDDNEGAAPLAEVPASMGAGPTGNSSGDSNIGTGSGPARRRWSRLPWVLAGVAFLLIVAVNAVAVSATTPKAGPVGAAVGQELLPAGALGARFALAHPAGPSAVRLGPLERRGASCAQRSRAWLIRHVACVFRSS